MPAGWDLTRTDVIWPYSFASRSDFGSSSIVRWKSGAVPRCVFFRQCVNFNMYVDAVGLEMDDDASYDRGKILRLGPDRKILVSISQVCTYVIPDWYPSMYIAQRAPSTSKWGRYQSDVLILDSRQ